MKILCVCRYGNVRSVALAYILKILFKQEAIAVGAKTSSDKTFKMMSDWADKIIFLTTRLDRYQLMKHNPKVILMDIGSDVWHDANHQNLKHLLFEELAKHKELWVDK